MRPMPRLALAALLVAAACGQSSSSAPSPISRRGLAVPVGDSPQRPDGATWVTVIEFGDFQCPYCRAEEPVVQHLGAVYGADLRVVFKHLPLATLHRYARAAAIGAACAGEQGRFWELHDQLFALPASATWVDDAAAAVAGLDLTAWTACTSGEAAAARVDEDLALATQLGIGGTPTFVVNGAEVVGAWDEASLRSVIDGALAAAKASGVGKADYYDQVVLGLKP